MLHLGSIAPKCRHTLLNEGLLRLPLLVAGDLPQLCPTTPSWCEIPAEQPHFTPPHHQQPLQQLHPASCLPSHTCSSSFDFFIFSDLILVINLSHLSKLPPSAGVCCNLVLFLFSPSSPFISIAMQTVIPSLLPSPPACFTQSPSAQAHPEQTSFVGPPHTARKLA